MLFGQPFFPLSGIGETLKVVMVRGIQGSRSTFYMRMNGMSVGSKPARAWQQETVGMALSGESSTEGRNADGQALLKRKIDFF